MTSRKVRSSVACVRCGYDLLGLAPDGVCPECGELIASTLPPCPRCLLTDYEPVALTPLPSSSIGTWSCERCAGIGFEKNRLREVTKSLERSKVEPTKAVFDLIAQSTVRCTRCRVPMQAIVLDAAHLIDRCNTCGMIWVDFGEMGPLANYLRRNLGAAPTPRNLEEMLADPQALRRAAEKQSLAGDDLCGSAVQTGAITALVLAWLFGS